MKKIIKFFNNKLLPHIYKFRPIHIITFPKTIRIETSTFCNLKCPLCPTGRGEERLSKGFLKFSDFKKFLDRYGFLIEDIYLSNKGELFLNPEIFEIIKYASNKGIKTHADTNLNFFNKEMAEKLVLSGMYELTVSIDGASSKSYSQYRVNGDFQKVISNIKDINQFKERYNSKEPHLKWQFILFGHNENDIDKAKKMAKDLKMNFFLKSSWNNGFSVLSKFSEIKKNWKVYEGEKSFCDGLWKVPTINYNGNMLGCCIFCDEKYHLGNVFEKGFFKIYNGKRMKRARKMVVNKIGKDESIFCSRCKFRKNPRILNSENLSEKKDLIVTLADRNFVDAAKQVFSSAYWNAGWKGDYMLLAHEIPEKDLKWFREKGILVKKCKPLYDKPIGRDNYPPTVLDKFYLFTEEFKKWRHIIFLDADVIVRGSLDRLTETKKFSSPKILNKNFDSYFSFNSEDEEKLFNKKYNLNRPTFNSGVMSFNTNIIKEDTFDCLVSLFKKNVKIINGDDSVFNLFFYPIWKKISIKYNIRLNNSKKKKGIILHFEAPFRCNKTNCKPWDKGNIFYNEWRSNLDKAEFIYLVKIQSAKKFHKNLFNFFR